jgi:hypothetical protein
MAELNNNLHPGISVITIRISHPILQLQKMGLIRATKWAGNKWQNDDWRED